MMNQSSRVAGDGVTLDREKGYPQYPQAPHEENKRCTRVKRVTLTLTEGDASPATLDFRGRV